MVCNCDRRVLFSYDLPYCSVGIPDDAQTSDRLIKIAPVAVVISCYVWSAGIVIHPFDAGCNSRYIKKVLPLVGGFVQIGRPFRNI